MSEDWHIWILLVQETAESDKADIWPMIDPSKTKDELTPISIKPVAPLSATIREGVTSILDFRPPELGLWNTAYMTYTHQLKEYKKVRSALNRVKIYITSTVTRRNLRYITGKTSVYDKLQALRIALAPSTTVHKERII